MVICAVEPLPPQIGERVGLTISAMTAANFHPNLESYFAVLGQGDLEAGKRMK